MTLPPGDPAGAEARILTRAADLPALGAPVAIDIPIGLMDAPSDGPRPPDRAARAFLTAHNRDGVRGPGSRVFPAPTRAHLAILRAGGGYADLRARFRKGEHLSKQCFMICPKILELDDLCRADPDGPFREAHPEISFAGLTGRTLAPKRSAEGAGTRAAVLRRAGFDLDRLAAMLPRRRALWAADDLVDACALALTAERIAEARHRGLPGLHDRDSLGLRRAIFY